MSAPEARRRLSRLRRAGCASRGPLNADARPHLMPAHFMFLQNTGSPTRWEVSRYFDYLARIRASLPADLQSLTEEARYELPSTSTLSMWRSGVTHFHVDVDHISIGARNDHRTRQFEFDYAGVHRFQTTSTRADFMPTIVIQELVQLRNGLLRHTFSDMHGDLTTIHAASLSFRDNVIQ